MSQNLASRGLSPRQQRVIAAILANRTLEAAAKAAGVNRRTISRYCEDPGFRDAYEEAIHRAHAAAASAINSLTEIVESPTAKAGDRGAAAKAILEQANLAADKFEKQDAESAEQARKATDPMTIIGERLNERMAVCLAHDAGVPIEALFRAEWLLGRLHLSRPNL